MKKQLLFVLVTLISMASAFAQPGMKKKVKKAKQLKERILLVPVEDSEFGKRFKSAVEKTWTYNENVKFITEEEFKKFKKNKKERKSYAVLDFYESDRRTDNLGSVVKVSLLDKVNSPVHYIMISAIHMTNKFNKKNKKEKINEADLLFAIAQLHSQVINLTKYEKMDRKVIIKKLQEHNENALKDLKTKTLLIDENMLTKRALKEFKANYKYPYKVVPKEVIDDAITNSYDDKIYIKGILQATGFIREVTDFTNNSSLMTIVTYSIYDSETNDQIYLLLPMGNFNLSKKDVKNFLEKIK